MCLSDFYTLVKFPLLTCYISCLRYICRISVKRRFLLSSHCLEVGPIQSSQGLWGSAVSSLSGVWTEPQRKIVFLRILTSKICHMAVTNLTIFGSREGGERPCRHLYRSCYCSELLLAHSCSGFQL